MWLVTTYWRTSLHIGSMRVFDSIEDAKEYKKTLDANWTRMYEVFPDKPPTLVKKEKV